MLFRCCLAAVSRTRRRRWIGMEASGMGAPVPVLLLPPVVSRQSPLLIFSSCYKIQILSRDHISLFCCEFCTWAFWSAWSQTLPIEQTVPSARALPSRFVLCESSRRKFASCGSQLTPLGFDASIARTHVEHYNNSELVRCSQHNYATKPCV